NHFDDKATLLAAVAEEAVDGLYAAMREAEQRARTPADHLEAIGVAYVAFAAEQPARFRLISMLGIGRKTAHPALVAAYERSFGVRSSSMTTCQAAGAGRQGVVRRMALGAWSTVHGLATLLV